MAKITAEIKLSECDEIKTFFELIADNMDDIREPLRSKIKDWTESEDKGWVKWGDIAPEFIDNNNCIVMMDGIEQQLVTGYNRVLQKVKFFEPLNRSPIRIASPKSFSIKNVGFDNFVEWGE